jgi:hypothetical protein
VGETRRGAMEQRRRVYRTNSRRTNVPNVDPAVIAALPPDLVPFMHRSLERRYEMEDPVVAKDGHTYEREAIEAYALSVLCLSRSLSVGLSPTPSPLLQVHCRARQESD